MLLLILVIFSFFLLPSSFSQDEYNLKFIHITDIHIDYLGIMYPNSSKYFECLKKVVTYVRPSFIIASGDNVEFGEGIFGDLNYNMLTSRLYKSNGIWYIDENFQIPIYFVPGNHEYHSILKVTYCDIPNYKKFIGDEFYLFDYGDALFVILNTGYDYYWDPFNYNWLFPNPEGSGIGGRQLKFLENTLTSKSNFRKVVVTHHPPVNYEGGIEDGVFLDNESFLEICNRYGVSLFLSGHTHEDKVFIRDSTKISVLNFPDSTNISYDKEVFIQTPSFGFDGSYRIIEMKRDYMVIHSVKKVSSIY